MKVVALLSVDLSPLHPLGQTLVEQSLPLSGQTMLSCLADSLSGSSPSSGQLAGSPQLQVRIGLFGQMCWKFGLSLDSLHL